MGGSPAVPLTRGALRWSPGAGSAPVQTVLRQRLSISPLRTHRGGDQDEATAKSPARSGSPGDDVERVHGAVARITRRTESERLMSGNNGGREFV
jgi:hypothetical protein